LDTSFRVYNVKNITQIIVSFYQIVVYGVLGLTYLGLAVGYVPGLRMNRPTIAVVGSSFLISQGRHQRATKQRALYLLLRLTRSPLGLLIALTVGTGVEAAASLGYRLTFWEHLRFGAPLTVLTLGFVYWWVR
jgi:hypothetical protein